MGKVAGVLAQQFLKLQLHLEPKLLRANHSGLMNHLELESLLIISDTFLLYSILYDLQENTFSTRHARQSWFAR